MQYKDLTQLNEDELRGRLQEAREAYYQWREDVFSGKEQNHGKLRVLRRDIARIETALRQVREQS